MPDCLVPLTLQQILSIPREWPLGIFTWFLLGAQLVCVCLSPALWFPTWKQVTAEDRGSPASSAQLAGTCGWGSYPGAGAGVWEAGNSEGWPEHHRAPAAWSQAPLCPSGDESGFQAQLGQGCSPAAIPSDLPPAASPGLFSGFSRLLPKLLQPPQGPDEEPDPGAPGRADCHALCHPEGVPGRAVPWVRPAWLWVRPCRVQCWSGCGDGR